MLTYTTIDYISEYLGYKAPGSLQSTLRTQHSATCLHRKILVENPPTTVQGPDPNIRPLNPHFGCRCYRGVTLFGRRSHRAARLRSMLFGCLLLSSRTNRQPPIPGKRILSWQLVVLGPPVPGHPSLRGGYKSLLSVDRVRSQSIRVYESEGIPNHTTVSGALESGSQKVNFLQTLLLAHSSRSRTECRSLSYFLSSFAISSKRAS